MARRRETTRAAIYLRISLDHTGEGLAVERQRADCERIARERGWKIVATYTDNSISASDKAKVRPDYDRMVRDYSNGRFDAVICWDLDRLTRQPRQLEDWIDAATERGLLLVTANGEADLSTDGGRLFARIKASVARAEVERKGARQSAAQRQRAAMGRPPRGVRPTGYTLDGEVISHEAEAVHAIFTAFSKGSSLKAIAAALSGAEQVERDEDDRTLVQRLPHNVPVLPTRSGRPWNPTSVIGILRNPRYAGWSALDGEIVRDSTGAPVQGQWKPLVSDTLWLDVQRRLDDPARKTNRVGTDRKHLGAGLFLCGVCDKPVKTHGGRYRCAGHVMRSRAPIDDLLLSTIRALLARPDLADLLPVQDEHRAGELREAVKKQRDRIARARADYTAELIDGSLYKEIKDGADQEIQRLEAERLMLTAGDASAAVLRAESPVNAFDNADLAETRAVIDTLCTVRLYPAPRGRKSFDPETVEITPRFGTSTARTP
ncbi:recombinase family protein [Nonomuraea lactucae]|uniref:recombinase family protein n=1 Tax=Nonomuraea lactucae TaxID=2249762 RepID=UPI000DE25649|nr:recombinase family protein [Nonomuraea lactucae]